MVHCSLFGQFCYGRHDSKSIGSQKYNHIRMFCNTWNDGTRNVIQRVSHSSIFSQSAVIEIRFSTIVINNYIFHYGSKSNGVPDLWFIFFPEVYTFRVTSTFEIKDFLSDQPCSSSPTSAL